MLQQINIGYVLYKLNIDSLICSAILVEFTQQSTEIQNASNLSSPSKIPKTTATNPIAQISKI